MPLTTYESLRAGWRSRVNEFLDRMAPQRERWLRRHRYYYQELNALIGDVVPRGVSVCHVACDSPLLLRHLEPSVGAGVCLTATYQKACQAAAPEYSFWTMEDLPSISHKFDYVVISSLGYLFDIQESLEVLKPLLHFRSKLIILNYNFLWEPVFRVAEKLGLRMPQPLQRQNMVPTAQVINLLQLAGMPCVKWSAHLLLPVRIPVISRLVNKFLSSVFPFRMLASTDRVIARPLIKPPRPVTCSVIVPCKNEKGHIQPLLSRMPILADGVEIVLVDDSSTDGTGGEMHRCAALHPDKTVRIVEGPGISKGEAVRAGVHAATGDIIAILDGDLAVLPEELPKCIQPLLDGVADFVNTVRFVYPQESAAMRWPNVAGNRVFAQLFTFLIQQKIGDTLCGTKVFWRADYRFIDDLKDFWLARDRWGDFEQLLGAGKIGLKIVDIPIHYASRSYGETKMKNRFGNALHMLRLCLGALLRLRLR